MRPLVIVVPFLNVAGMALFPFILVYNKAALEDKVLINHERIHLQQQLELLVLPFYALYLLNYLYNYIRFRNHHKAYMAISFEREAYHHEREMGYLVNRRWYTWLRFL
ncbi:hypothetical protein DYU05_11230 [Mucilaginibacter terrenus]|uniref:DUF4157 domain-containing protein n=1 Tax=Mucilaginibacter terrenus TaxID=2482727 RepID=A0A3E2NP19_9SPHI|nr:hypothetical protein [Mucilaginibacter terrenus]RFZ82738.1 hypothetical protein DYU05_11230 [Mucilaginibacter terrenus]